MSNFNDKLQTLLKTDSRFVDQEGDLLRNEVIDKAFKIDENLIELLISDDEVKSKFFCEIKGHWVFNINTFVDFIQDKNFLNDSYTKYKNKIGLNIGGRFLKERNEVSLVRPYKDCILEGGQSKEDQKRKEIFFNETLAQDEIDRLLDPKVLTSWKKYNKDGEQKVEGFTRDENGTIKDNLIIKGNNLLALHTLKKEFAGKVKLVYIDPPYNTGSDGFNYNDSFNHSTWLTFIKNRLEVAKELLNDDGSIFVQIDHNEQAYLKVLLDDIFGRENFRNEIVRKRSQNISSISEVFRRSHDTILFYSKSNKFHLNRLFREHEESYLKQYDKYDSIGQYRHVPLLVSGKRNGITGKPWRGLDPNEFGKEGMHRLTTHEKLEELDKQNLIYRPKKGQPMRKYYLADSEGRQVDDIWDDIKLVTPSSKEGLGLMGQKPEELLKRILEAGTAQKDLVLDFFGGSGTTGAVAHKMSRQYILLEQMDYIHDLPEARLKRVINDEQSGISKAVNRQGGGEFIYCELKKYNQDFIDRIEKSKDTKELLKTWENMKSKSFLNYNVDITKQDEAIEEFKQLSLNQQKQALVELLDKNQLYVNLSEINDKNFKVSDEDKKLNDLFYNL